jgi:hypothetical protein
MHSPVMQVKTKKIFGDKEDFVRPLAEAVSEIHLHIWYGEFSGMTSFRFLQASNDNNCA